MDIKEVLPTYIESLGLAFENALSKHTQNWSSTHPRIFDAAVLNTCSGFIKIAIGNDTLQNDFIVEIKAETAQPYRLTITGRVFCSLKSKADEAILEPAVYYLAEDFSNLEKGSGIQKSWAKKSRGTAMSNSEIAKSMVSAMAEKVGELRGNLGV